MNKIENVKMKVFHITYIPGFTTFCAKNSLSNSILHALFYHDSFKGNFKQTSSNYLKKIQRSCLPYYLNTNTLSVLQNLL